jgi:hypothetical protein
VLPAVPDEGDDNLVPHGSVRPAERPIQKNDCSVLVLPAVPDEGDDNLEVMPHSSDRPSRPCPFCGKFKVRLTRHIRAVHKSEEQVSLLMGKTINSQRESFKQLRRKGILQHNISIAGKKGMKLMRERTSKHESGAVVCDSCSGVFNRHWFSAHIKKCKKTINRQPSAVAASVFFSPFNVNDDFKRDILSKFSSDDVGQFCQNDETIAMIGCKLFMKIKARKDKKVEVKRSVMTDMRRLVHVYKRFRDIRKESGSVNDNVAVLDMFKRQHFNNLEEACSRYTSGDEENEGKSGLQLAVYYLLIKVAKIVKVFHLINNDDTRAQETSEFIDVLHYSKDSMIGGAIYHTNKNRNTKLRRVENLPQVEDVNKLKSYISTKCHQLLDDPYLQWTKSEFVELRDMACARLTLYNARRGGEPARLRISDWQDAQNQVWLDKNRLHSKTPEEQEIISQSLVMYQTGKGLNSLTCMPPNAWEYSLLVSFNGSSKLFSY